MLAGTTSAESAGQLRVNIMSGGYYDPRFPFGFYLPGPSSHNISNMQSMPSSVPSFGTVDTSSDPYTPATQLSRHSPSSPPQLNEGSGGASSSSSSPGEDAKKPKQYDKWNYTEQQFLLSLWADRFDRLESKDARKVWDEVVRELNKKFNTTRPADKCKAKIKYLIEKYKAAKDWNVNQSGGNRCQSMFYEEIDAVLGCRDVVTLRHVSEAGSSESSSEVNQPDKAAETDTSAVRKGRKLKRNRQRAQIDVEDDEEKEMMKASFAGLQEQRKEMSEFMKSFSKTQEQQVNTMNALVGALTNFLQSSNKN